MIVFLRTAIHRSTPPFSAPARSRALVLLRHRRPSGATLSPLRSRAQGPGRPAPRATPGSGPEAPTRLARRARPGDPKRPGTGGETRCGARAGPDRPVRARPRRQHAPPHSTDFPPPHQGRPPSRRQVRRNEGTPWGTIPQSAPCTPCHVTWGSSCGMGGKPEICQVNCDLASSRASRWFSARNRAESSFPAPLARCGRRRDEAPRFTASRASVHSRIWD